MDYLKVKRSILSNGMVLVTENNPTSKSISLGFWVRSGSANESQDEHGASHFIEHMMFKGTKSRSPLQIAREIEKVGGELNAFTDREVTCYYTTILAEDVHLALNIFSDIIQNSTFPEDEIKRERDVILEEIKMYEDSPDDLVVDLFYETIFPKQIFGRSIIGTKKSIKGISRKKLWQIYKKTHQPGTMFVTAAGLVDHEKLADEIEKQFHPTKSKLNLKTKITKAVAKKSSKTKPIEQVHLVLGYPTSSFASSDRYLLRLLNIFIGHGMGSQLFQRVREERGLAYSVFSALNQHKDIGVFLLYAGTSPLQVEKCLSSMKEVIEEVKRNGLNEEQLEETKKQLKGLLLLSAQTSEERMSSLGLTELYIGRESSLEDEVYSIEGVRLEEINELSKRLFAQDLTYVSVGPPASKKSKKRTN